VRQGSDAPKQGAPPYNRLLITKQFVFQNQARGTSVGRGFDCGMILATSVDRMGEAPFRRRYPAKNTLWKNMLTLFQHLTYHICHRLGFTAEGKQLRINHEKEIHFKIRLL
jgi:hypothetical protein